MTAKYTSLVAIFSYCGSSILMTLVNKLVLSYFSHPIVFLMLAVQAGFCVAFVKIFGLLQLLSFRSFNTSDGKKWLPVSILMATMLYTGGKSLQYLSVPLFTIFKNLTIIVVAYGEYLVFGSQVTAMMLLSFALMVLSSIVGGWYDISFNFAGYLWMFANCLSSASFVIFLRKTIKHVNFKDFDTVYFNNLLTFPMFLGMSLLTEDWPGLYTFYSDETNMEEYYQLMRGLIISGISAFAISYTSAWCIRVTNSTTYSMIGALNKLPIALFAMVYFKDKMSVGGVSALIIGFSAGVVYSHAKNLQKRLTPPAATSTSSYKEVDVNDARNIDGEDVELPITMKDIEKESSD